MYAQTNIQLFDQLRGEGYSNAELNLIRQAYALAVKLFTGLYRPCGKTFIAHVIGTASILSEQGVSANLIAAALVHAAYEHGDFGTAKKGISIAKREHVRRVVGKVVEEHVARYAALRWSPDSIPAIYDGLDELAPIDREILLMRLANELDDLRDLGILYSVKAERKRIHYGQFGPVMIKMAERLGFPLLAAELTQALTEAASAEVFSGLRSRNRRTTRFAPRSYRRRTGIALREELGRLRNRFEWLVRRGSRVVSAAKALFAS
jgi:(p)ppGpp synthase/HD superfamily hydrolase